MRTLDEQTSRIVELLAKVPPTLSTHRPPIELDDHGRLIFRARTKLRHGHGGFMSMSRAERNRAWKWAARFQREWRFFLNAVVASPASRKPPASPWEVSGVYVPTMAASMLSGLR